MGEASSLRKVLKPKRSYRPLLQFSRISLSQAQKRADHPRVSPPSVRPSFLPHRRISCSPHLSPTTKTALRLQEGRGRVTRELLGPVVLLEFDTAQFSASRTTYPKKLRARGGEEGGAVVDSAWGPGSCSSHFRGNAGGCGFQRTSWPRIPQEKAS